MASIVNTPVREEFYIGRPERSTKNHLTTFMSRREYPRLSVVVKNTGVCVSELLEALQSVLVVAYGENHFHLDKECLRMRRTLYMFINLVRQISLLEDIDHYTCAFKCPIQLEEYNECLRVSIQHAQQRGLPDLTLSKARAALNCLGQVQQEITLYRDGLS
jgi:hypothetical protein